MSTPPNMDMHALPERNRPTKRFWSRRRTPVVLQSEVAECGLACVVMIARHHGSRIDLAGARTRCEISPRGVTLPHLLHIAGQIGLSSRVVRLDLLALHELRVPCVLHWDFEHFVVLIRAQGDMVTVHDPSLGRQKLPMSEVSRRFTGIAIELDPLPELFLGSAGRSRPWATLAPAVNEVKPLLGQLLLLTVLLQLVLVLAPLQVRWLVDDVLSVQDAGWIATLGLGFGMLTLLQVIVAALRGWLIAVIGAKLGASLFARVVEHLLKLPMPWFLKRNVGDILTRLESVQAIQRTLASDAIETLVDATLLALSMGMMLQFNLVLAGVTGAAGLAYFGLRMALYGYARAATEETIVRGTRRSTHLIESVRGIQTVKLFGRERQRAESATDLSVEQFNSRLREQRLHLVAQAASGLLFGLENVATLSLGAHFIAAGTGSGRSFTLGMLMAFLAYKAQFVQRLGGLLEKSIECRLLTLHAERLAEIADAEPEPNSTGTGGLALDRWSVELRDVSFRYASLERPILENVSLRIEEGECVAIVGPSGCGKSTLLKLILGLLSPTTGEVLVGGRGLSQVDVRAYRNRVGTVMQDDLLFGGTIAQNICFFDPEPDQALIEACAGTAGFHDEIVQMPMRYRTLVGDMGGVLSGGQRQRLLLARALYRRPRVLLLDEATSHLDVGSEAAINEAVRSLGITRIIIAHRPQTIASAGRVIEFRGGRLMAVPR